MNFKVCPKKPRSQQFSGFSSEMGVANSVVMTCPETLTHQLSRVYRLNETVSILQAGKKRAQETDNFEQV